MSRPFSLLSGRRTACGLALLTLVACASGPSDADASDAALFTGPLLEESSWTHYGAGVHAGPAIEATDVLERPEQFESGPVRVAGDIVSVCKMKGCWVRVGGTDDNILVRFKDYGFFLPTDASGRVVLEGFVAVKELSVEVQQHYLEDEGRDAEAQAVTAPKEQVTLLAHGAALAKR